MTEGTKSFSVIKSNYMGTYHQIANILVRDVVNGYLPKLQEDTDEAKRKIQTLETLVRPHILRSLARHTTVDAETLASSFSPSVTDISNIISKMTTEYSLPRYLASRYSFVSLTPAEGEPDKGALTTGEINAVYSVVNDYYVRHKTSAELAHFIVGDINKKLFTDVGVAALTERKIRSPRTLLTNYLQAKLTAGAIPVAEEMYACFASLLASENVNADRAQPLFRQYRIIIEN